MLGYQYEIWVYNAKGEKIELRIFTKDNIFSKYIEWLSKKNHLTNTDV
jgi:uncharacterized protein YxeA